MELRHLRYFVAVAETLSFRQASKQLRVSQPSLSVQIKQLENELGVVLFRRSKRRVEITRAGEVFLSAAREILLRLKQASAAALHAESGEVGTIRLGFIPTATFHIIPRLLEKIRSTLPLELREGSEDIQITGLRTGSLDVCIGHLSRTYDQIENMLLIREPLVLALPKGHKGSPQEGCKRKGPSRRALHHAVEGLVARSASNDHDGPAEESHTAGQISNGGTFSDRGQPHQSPSGNYVPSIFCKRLCS
jgi:LysR family hca operon transcriptional activator